MSARKSVFSNLGATCLPRGSSICPEEPHGLPTSENHTHPSSLAPHKRLPHTQVPEPCLDPWVLGEASGPAGPWLWGYWGLSEGFWPPPPPPRQRGLGTRLEIKKSKRGGGSVIIIAITNHIRDQPRQPSAAQAMSTHLEMEFARTSGGGGANPTSVSSRVFCSRSFLLSVHRTNKPLHVKRLGLG